MFGKISKKIVISQEDELRNIPIFNAVINNKLEVIQALFAKDNNVIHTQASGSKKTPLHIAVELNNNEIAAFLISKGAEVDAGTQRGFTPLHVAAQIGNETLVECFANAGATIDARSDVGCTPLHEAAAKGREKAVLALLKFRADPNCKETKYNLTPANLAHEKNFGSIRDILCNAMTYQQRFISNVNYILFNWKRKFSPNSPELLLLDNMITSIGSVVSADEAFIMVTRYLKSAEFHTLHPTLMGMRKLFIANMNQYNADKTAEMNKLEEARRPTI